MYISINKAEFYLIKLENAFYEKKYLLKLLNNIENTIVENTIVENTSFENTIVENISIENKNISIENTSVENKNISIENTIVENKNIRKKYIKKIELFKYTNGKYCLIKKKPIYKHKVIDIDINDSNIRLNKLITENKLLNKNYLNIDNIKNYINNYESYVNEIEKHITLDLNYKIPNKNKKRILSLVEWGYPPFGGGENWLLNLNKIFNKFDYECYLICFSDPFKNEFYEEFNFIDLNYVTVIQMPKNIELIIKIIGVIQPDIINHQGVYREYFMKISNIFEIPFLTGFCFWNNIVEFDQPNINVNMIENNTLKPTFEFDNIIGNSYAYSSSNFVNDIINKLYNTKLDVIETISLKDDFYVNENEKNKTMVTLINCHFNKGGFLIEHLCKHLNFNIPLQFIYTENDPDIPVSYIRNLINDRNSFNNINILIENKVDIKEIYKNTKILLIPSICDETFCRVAYEGMINGIPIISSKNGNLKYLLDNYAIFIDSIDVHIWKDEIEKLYFKNNLFNDFYISNPNFPHENTIENKIYNKLSSITDSKYKYNSNNIGLIVPWADQGLGIQSRDYYISLKEFGYEPYIFSFKPYHATHENIRLQTNKEEWEYDNIHYSDNYREDITIDEIVDFVYRYKIKRIIIIEATFSNIFKIALYLKILGIKVFLIVNVECIQLFELKYHNIFDKILTNNYDSQQIISTLFKNKSYLLNFHLNYPYYKTIVKNNKTDNFYKFCCFGGLNSISRKNIDIVIKSFYKIFILKKYLNWQLNVFIQGVEIPELIKYFKSPNIIYHVNNLSYIQIIDKYKENDICIHLGSHEGLGLGFYESLYTSTPLITMDWTPNNEIIKNNINGWIIPCSYSPVNDNSYSLIQMGIIQENVLYQKIINIITDSQNTNNIINNTINNCIDLYETNKNTFKNNFINILQ